ncbi:MAG: hypothetical protein RLZZ165_225 [Bacteroidota bacterium]|jgi:hypothetical protein
MAHVLVVGGTSILDKVSLFLASHDNVVTVLARSEDDLDKLCGRAGELSGKINVIKVDYQEADRLSERLHESIQAHGPFTLAVNWVHEQVLKVLDMIASILNATSPVCRYFQILPAQDLPKGKERKYYESIFLNLERVLYRIIVLGFKREKGATLRLNHDEISDGVIQALCDDSKNAMIGTVDPWEDGLEVPL